MTIDDIQNVALSRAREIESGHITRAESRADWDIIQQYKMIADLAAAVADLVKEQGRQDAMR